MSCGRRWIEREDGVTLVELLVVMVMVAIIGTSTMAVVLTMQRTTQTTNKLADVMNDGRVSLDRISKELREARRVNVGSDASELRFWVDENQDDVQQSSELITYGVQDLGNGRYQIVRWTDAAPGTARVIARTLLNQVVFAYVDQEGNVLTPGNDDPAIPGTDDVTAAEVVTLDADLQVASSRGPSAIDVFTTVRLRNVGDA